jgi:hypothetical protein
MLSFWTNWSKLYRDPSFLLRVLRSKDNTLQSDTVQSHEYAVISSPTHHLPQSLKPALRTIKHPRDKQSERREKLWH